MAKMKKSVTGTSPVWQVCTYAVLLLVVLVAVFPAIWMLVHFHQASHGTI